MPSDTHEHMVTHWEYCKLVDGTIHWLAAHGLFADKNDSYGADTGKAWDRLSDEGWELVSVVADKDGKIHHYFKRGRSAGK